MTQQEQIQKLMDENECLKYDNAQLSKKNIELEYEVRQLKDIDGDVKWIFLANIAAVVVFSKVFSGLRSITERAFTDAIGRALAYILALFGVAAVFVYINIVFSSYASTHANTKQKKQWFIWTILVVILMVIYLIKW